MLHIIRVEDLRYNQLSSDMALLSHDLAPALALLGQGAGPRHQGQVAVLIGWITQTAHALKPGASEQARLPVRERIKAVAAMVGAHPTGPCETKSGHHYCSTTIPCNLYSAATRLPTPPNGSATIRLCRMLSLEQKLPLEVSLMSLETTCVVRDLWIRSHRLHQCGVLTRVGHVPCCCWNMRTHRGVSPAY